MQVALAEPGPHQLRAAYLLAQAAGPLGRPDLAEALLRRILSATDALLAPFLALGLLLVGQGRHVEAIEVYEAALARHPGHPDLARVIADATVAYDALGLYEEGLALCRRAIDELGAREPLLLRNLGVLYLRLDQPAPAREALRAAGAAAPWLRDELGELWARWGDGGPL